METDFTDRFAFPSHRNWRKSPAWMARNALIRGGLVQRDIFFGVTLRAIRSEVSGIAAPDSRHVLVMVSSLQGVIACGMTAHAPRMRQDFSNLGKNRARAF